MDIIKNIRVLAGAAMLAVCLVSCGPHKLKFSQIDMKEDRIYKGEEPFTGQVWSEDGKSFCLTSRNGEVTSFAMYHANGREAIRFDNVDDELKAYDEAGEEMPIDSFAVEYRSLAETLHEIFPKDSVK